MDWVLENTMESLLIFFSWGNAMVISFKGKMVLIRYRSLVRYTGHNNMIVGLRLEERRKKSWPLPWNPSEQLLLLKIGHPNPPKWLPREWTTLPLLRVCHFENCLELPKTPVSAKWHVREENIPTETPGVLTWLVELTPSSPVTPVCSVQDQDHHKCSHKINQGNIHLYVSVFMTRGGLGNVLLAKCKYY